MLLTAFAGSLPSMERTARNFMRVYRRFSEMARIAAHGTQTQTRPRLSQSRAPLNMDLLVDGVSACLRHLFSSAYHSAMGGDVA